MPKKPLTKRPPRGVVRTVTPTSVEYGPPKIGAPDGPEAVARRIMEKDLAPSAVASSFVGTDGHLFVFYGADSVCMVRPHDLPLLVRALAHALRGRVS